MKKLSSPLLAGLLTLGLALPAAAADLLEAYSLAKDNDPEIQAAEANYRAAQEASPQAWAGYLPQISGSYTLSNTDTDRSGEQFFGGQTFPSEYTEDSDNTQWSLNLRQTVFNWGSIKQIGKAKADVAKAEADYLAAQQTLIVRVSERYFDLLRALDSLEAARINREAIGRQLEQTKKRFEVGLIAITDVQESQAAYDQAMADEIAAERQISTARERLRVVVGQYIDNPAAPVQGMPLAKPEPADAASWVNMALEQNLSIIANRFNVESAQKTVDIRRSGHFPTLDLVARHSDSDSDFTAQQLGNPQSTGTSAFAQDYVGIELSVPIFSGGRTQSEVRQAAAQASAAKANLNLAVRNTESQARDAYLGVTSDISRVEALRQALESSRTALKATQAGYEVGTRTAVDVLDARRNELRALVNYKNARYDYILNTLRLKQAAGTLSGEDVERIAAFME